MAKNKIRKTDFYKEIKDLSEEYNLERLTFKETNNLGILEENELISIDEFLNNFFSEETTYEGDNRWIMNKDLGYRKILEKLSYHNEFAGYKIRIEAYTHFSEQVHPAEILFRFGDKDFENIDLRIVEGLTKHKINKSKQLVVPELKITSKTLEIKLEPGFKKDILENRNNIYEVLAGMPNDQSYFY